MRQLKYKTCGMPVIVGLIYILLGLFSLHTRSLLTLVRDLSVVHQTLANHPNETPLRLKDSSIIGLFQLQHQQ